MEFYKLEATGNDFILTILDNVNHLNIKNEEDYIIATMLHTATWLL